MKPPLVDALGKRGEGHLWQPSYRDRHGVRKKSSIYWLKICGFRLSTGTSDPKKARAFQLEKAVELGKGNVAALAGETVTIEKLRQRIVDDYERNGRRSTSHIKTNFVHLAKHLGHVKVARIDEDVLAHYVAARLREKAAPATVNLELAALQRAMNLMKRKLPRIPEIPYLHVRNARQGFFERPEFDAILAHLPEHLRPPLEVAYITGWRFDSEILTREWKHVDFGPVGAWICRGGHGPQTANTCSAEGCNRFRPGWLRIEDSKNDEGREFPLTVALRATLEAQRERTTALEHQLGRVIPWVFHHRGGKKIVSIQKSWATARRKAGIPNRLVHDLRRTAVRNLEEAGVARSAAMKMVGHKTEAIYRRYAISDRRHLSDSGAMLDALHEAQKGQAAKVTAMPDREEKKS
jgi:integrase